MLLIHIRNPCKMHYQVSLNQNITKELVEYEGMQDPTETGLYPAEESVKTMETREKPYRSSISPMRDNDAQNKARIISMLRGKTKDRSISSCNSIEILDKVLQKRCTNFKQETFGKSNIFSAGSEERRKSVSPFRSISPISISPLTNIKTLFAGFCNKYNAAQSAAPRSYTAKRVQAQFKFIRTIRKCTFQTQFIKKLVFSVWKMWSKNTRDKTV